VGYQALYNNTTGERQTAVGYKALFSNSTGVTYNTALGFEAGYANTTANAGVFIGYQAGNANTTGVDNTFVGNASGYTTTTGYRNVYVGSAARGSAATNNNETVIGFDIAGKGSSTAFIAGTSGAYNGANSATWSVTSDQRLKKNIVDNTVGLEKLTQIQVRNFEYRLPEEVDAELKPQDAVQRTGVQLGVIAQELQAILPDCVKTESTGVMTVDQNNLTWYLINAVKQLKAEIDQLKGN
jgi:hypothetical protein